MSAIANIVNGEITNNGTVNSSGGVSEGKSGGALDKDAFLKLLVAQMKCQDPLEPTDNTEYVSQLATFSELEEMQNMVQGTDMQRASMLVGQYVGMTETDSTGKTKYVEGYVESVVYQNGKTYLSIEGQLYSFDNLDSVYDSTYVEALNAAAKLIEEAVNAAGDTSGGSDKADA